MNDVDDGRLDMGDWQEWSRQLAELALMAKDAAENRDQTAFADAGDAMVEVCEACHTAYLTGAQ
jgi:cytochrome c2